RGAEGRKAGSPVGEDRAGGAAVGQCPQQGVALPLRADVDAARWVEAEQRAEARREPAGDRHLLLVAPGEPAHLALRAGVDLEVVDGLADPAPLVAHVDWPPAAGAVVPRSRNILGDPALRRAGREPV